MDEPSKPAKFVLLTDAKAEQPKYRASVIICAEQLGIGLLDFIGELGVSKFCQVEIHELDNNCYGIKIL